MTVEEFFDKVITVRLKEDKSALDIIDQTLLPGTIKRIQVSTKEEIWEAIKKLRVRGAPAIGTAAAYGIALLASGITADRYDMFYAEFKELKDYLASSRPTAVNLFWALNRMEGTVTDNQDKDVAEIKALLFQEADAIREEDIQISRGGAMSIIAISGWAVCARRSCCWPSCSSPRSRLSSAPSPRAKPSRAETSPCFSSSSDP